MTSIPLTAPESRGLLDGSASEIRPRALDLFCCAGGAGMGLHLAGFDVTGIDVKPQPHYPFAFHQADAMTFPLEGFDFVWASPPCQAFTTLQSMSNAREHPELVEPIRDRLIATGVPFVIENVSGAPLQVGPPILFNDRSGITLCGTMFGLSNGEYELRRHRLFESNVPIVQPRCSHRLPVVGFYGDHARLPQRTVDGIRQRRGTDISDNPTKLRLVRELMGIDWMAWGEAVEAIPPAYSKYIGEQMMPHVMARVRGRLAAG